MGNVRADFVLRLPPARRCWPSQMASSPWSPSMSRAQLSSIATKRFRSDPQMRQHEGHSPDRFYILVWHTPALSVRHHLHVSMSSSRTTFSIRPSWAANSNARLPCIFAPLSTNIDMTSGDTLTAASSRVVRPCAPSCKVGCAPPAKPPHYIHLVVVHGNHQHLTFMV